MTDCKWCEDKIDPVSKPDQKFCSNRCKKQFEKAFDEISSDISLNNFPTILGTEFNQKIVNVR